MPKNRRPGPAGGKTAKHPPPPLKKSAPSIGTRRESSLHRSLKFHYSGREGDTETLAGNYVCDARTSEGELIEVQTGSFGPLKDKIKALTRTNRVRIIHPILVEKIIELYDEEGGLVYRRKSPKKGNPWELFRVLVYAPELPLLENLVIELALVDVAEKRADDGKGSWRRKGVRIADRSVSAWRGSMILEKPGDYRRFIPFKKNETFTVRDLGERAGINRAVAGKTLYVLTKMGLTERAGKQGNALVYKQTRRVPNRRDTEPAPDKR